jgi:hypothetical protein
VPLWVVGVSRRRFDPQVADRRQVDVACKAITEMLLEAGADAESRDHEGWTPLAYMASLGFTQVSALWS